MEIIQRFGTDLLHFSEDDFTALVETDDGVIAGWVNEDDIPKRGSILTRGDGGVVVWLGTSYDAHWSDRTVHKVGETPRIWMDADSAKLWLELADGASEAAAVEAINAQILHDADESSPDCDEIDPATGFACTLPVNHEGGSHVATTGRARIAHVFTLTA